jgi:hypothetical protein
MDWHSLPTHIETRKVKQIFLENWEESREREETQAEFVKEILSKNGDAAVIRVPNRHKESD